MRFNLSSMLLSRRVLGAAFATTLAASLGGCLGYDGEIQHGYVVDNQTLAQVKTGTSKEATLKIMGTPSTTSTVGGDAWYYISQKVQRKLAFSAPEVTDQRVVAVYFKNNRVERYADYGLKDGVVFDFISRTTPTGGAEPSFLGNMLKSFGRLV